MKLYKSFNLNKKFRNSIIAIGNFDGVHLGHQKVLRFAKSKARKKKTNFGILTFDPMPVMFFKKKIINHKIQTKTQKYNSIEDLEVDFLIEKKFDKKFSQTNYKDFIKKIIFRKLKCKFLFVSKNFRFGNKREGNVNRLKNFEKKFNYKTIVTSPLKMNKKIVSSTLIRKLITKGKIELVKKLLGRNWSIKGKVTKGFKRGRKIGFPTCNLNLNNYVIPKFGVYAVNVKINKTLKKGIANIGYRPTFNGKKLLLEVNIFRFKKNLYNKNINVVFKKFIRPEKKFKNIIELKNQIKKDIKQAK